MREEVTSGCKGRCLQPSCPWATLPRGRRRRDRPGAGHGGTGKGVPPSADTSPQRPAKSTERSHRRTAPRPCGPSRRRAVPLGSAAGQAGAGRPFRRCGPAPARPRLPRLARPRRAPALGQPGGGRAPQLGARELTPPSTPACFPGSTAPLPDQQAIYVPLALLSAYPPSSPLFLLHLPKPISFPTVGSSPAHPTGSPAQCQNTLVLPLFIPPHGVAF